MSDDNKWVGDVIEGISRGADLLRAGRELADAIDPADNPEVAKLKRIVAALCKRQQHDELTIGSLTERLRNAETELGTAKARISKAEKVLERRGIV